MKTYVDREVLLQVKRIYSQDEIIADLHRQLKEYGVKVGILESQIAELEDENKALHINRPIELPSDEEIEKEAFQIPFNNTNEFYDKSFIKGAKWMKEQILQPNYKNEEN